MLLVLFNPYIGPYQVLPLQARMDLGVMAMKEYSTSQVPALLKPHHQIVCHIQDTRWGGGLIPLQRSSRCILQPQPTGQYTELNVKSFISDNSVQHKYSLHVKNCSISSNSLQHLYAVPMSKQFYFKQFSLA